jgi:uncharacterized membrane protein YphA (DoxX/SURF4 family)
MLVLGEPALGRPARELAPLWDAENPGFLHNGGAAVAGFARHGTPAYTWWGSFLHNFVVPNAGGIAILVAVAELAFGIALYLGLFTRIAALGSLALLFTCVMSGTASVCAFYALFAIVILTMWRTSSWLGVDGYRQRHHHERGLHTPIRELLSKVAAGTPTADKTAWRSVPRPSPTDAACACRPHRHVTQSATLANGLYRQQGAARPGPVLSCQRLPELQWWSRARSGRARRSLSSSSSSPGSRLRAACPASRDQPPIPHGV